MSQIIEILTGVIIQLISSTSYLGIFILMFLESLFIPIPSEITMPFAGFLAASNSLNFVIVVLVGALANLAGSLVGYYVGYFLEEELIVRQINKYGKFILVTEADYHTAKGWFTKYGDKIVFFSRLLPGIRTFISLPAGIFEMDIKKFSIYTFAGSLIWSAGLTYVGYTAGKNWKVLEPIFRKLEIGIAIIIIIGILLYINHKLKIIKFHNK
jgi:membrane protein DedA with SNARE-associated domain